MKITDPQVIEDGEKDLITAVQEDLDLDAVKQILKDRMGASTLSSRGGEIVVHNNQIAFRLDFDIKLSGSLLFDRKGNYIDTGEEELLEPARETEMALEGFDAQEELNDKEIEPPYDGIPLVETGLDETDPDEIDTAEPDLSDQNLEEELSIGLPEYDLEEPEYETKPIDQEESDMPPLDLETGDLSDESMETQDLESMAKSNEVDTQNLENESLEENDLADEAVLDEEMLDDDINGILKESREFWEQKKDS
jgi:hypothetical protein